MHKQMLERRGLRKFTLHNGTKTCNLS